MKVAVVCAVNSGQNPGMVTVDRVASEFFSGRGAEIDWLIAGFEEDQDPGVDDLPNFRSIFNIEGFPDKYDRIIFWGDFLQSRIHHFSLANALLENGRAKDQRQALKILREFLLLEGASQETLAKVAIVGSSIHADGADLLVDTEYRKALTRLICNACSVRMREPLSSYRATMLSGRDGTIGMDAAFLSIRNNSWNTVAESNRRSGPVRIAVVGGRSDRFRGRKLKFAALATLKGFSRKGRKATLEVLPWLSESLGKWAWFSVETPSRARSPEYCLKRLSSCDALITDVYHAAINAWVLGIPVVLMGNGAEFDVETIQSKKKELLSLSVFAGRNYVFFEDVSYFRPRELGAQMVAILIDEKRNREVFKQRKRDVEWFWRKLESEIGLHEKLMVSNKSGLN